MDMRYLLIKKPLSQVAMGRFYLSCFLLLPLLGGFQAALSFCNFPCMQKGKPLLSDNLVVTYLEDGAVATGGRAEVFHCA